MTKSSIAKLIKDVILLRINQMISDHNNSNTSHSDIRNSIPDVSGKEDSSNKVSSWSPITSDTHYPSEKLVKDSLNTKLDKTDVPTKITDLTDDSDFIDSTELSETLSDYIDNENWTETINSIYDNFDHLSPVAESGDYADLVNTPDLSDVVRTNRVSGLIKNDGTIDTNTYLTTHQSLSDIGGEVTVEKQQNAEAGYSATYIVKQNGTQVGAKINIPKDFLVQDAGMSEVTTANDPVNGYSVGDKYLWFHINTENEDEESEYLYILVTDLIDVYRADNVTLELGQNNTFKIKNGGVDTTQLSAGVNTTLGYANEWNSSPAKTITSEDISKWNLSITVEDADDEIEEYLQAIIDELSD